MPVFLNLPMMHPSASGHSPVLFLGLLSRRSRRPLPRDQIFDRCRNGNVGEGGQGGQLADAFAGDQSLPLFQNVWVLFASADEDVGLERLGEGGVYAFLLGSLLTLVLLAAVTYVNLLLISIRIAKETLSLELNGAAFGVHFGSLTFPSSLSSRRSRPCPA